MRVYGTSVYVVTLVRFTSVSVVAVAVKLIEYDVNVSELNDRHVS